MKKTSDSTIENQARGALNAQKGADSWEALARRLKFKSGGYLWRVATGKRKPSKRLIAALCLPKPPRRAYDASTKALRAIGAKLYISI